MVWQVYTNNLCNFTNSVNISELLLHIWVGDANIKVSKFQKQIFLFSFKPKNEQNYFLKSALASKMGQIKKLKARHYIDLGSFDNVCFIKIRSELSSVLLLCLLRIFMKQTLQ